MNLKYIPVQEGLSFGLVGRTPWSAAVAPVGFCAQEQEAGQVAGCGPGGPPHQGVLAA